VQDFFYIGHAVRTLVLQSGNCVDCTEQFDDDNLSGANFKCCIYAEKESRRLKTLRRTSEMQFWSVLISFEASNVVL